MLIVQGESDRFGTPPATKTRVVVKVRGDHGLKSDPEAITEAVARWLAGLAL